MLLIATTGGLIAILYFIGVLLTKKAVERLRDSEMVSSLYKVAPPAIMEEESLEAGIVNIGDRASIKPLSVVESIFTCLTRRTS